MESPPSSKKLSATAHLLQPQHLGPDVGQGVLRRGCAGRRRPPPGPAAPAPAPAGPAGPPCRWASAAAPPAPRTPTAPCTPAAAPARNRRSSAAARPRRPRRRHVGHQPHVARAVRPGQHRRLAHPRVPRQGRLDLAQLDPEPRILTWPSARPRNSSSPSGRQRARSPVRYSRAAGSGPNGSATNRSAVSPGRPR